VSLGDVIRGFCRRLKIGGFLGVIVVAIALQFIGEQFPFSNFPMYAGLSSRSEFIYFTDFTGKKVGTWWWFDEGGAAMMKVLRSVWKKENSNENRPYREDKVAQKTAANYVYDTYLAIQPKEKRRRIEAAGPRLIYVEVTVKDGELVLTETVLVEREPVRP